MTTSYVSVEPFIGPGWLETGDRETTVLKHQGNHHALGSLPIKVYATHVEPTSVNAVVPSSDIGLDGASQARGLRVDYVWPGSPSPLATLNLGDTYTVNPGNKVWVGGPIETRSGLGIQAQMTRTLTQT